jgi:hypothetical protein
MFIQITLHVPKCKTRPEAGDFSIDLVNFLQENYNDDGSIKSFTYNVGKTRKELKENEDEFDQDR